MAPPTWTSINICTHPEVSVGVQTMHISLVVFSMQMIDDFSCRKINGLPCEQYMVLSGVVAMATCAVFLRLSCTLKLAVLLLAAALYTYLTETYR